MGFVVFFFCGFCCEKESTDVVLTVISGLVARIVLFVFYYLQIFLDGKPPHLDASNWSLLSLSLNRSGPGSSSGSYCSCV